jgi:hypothetical protein
MNNESTKDRKPETIGVVTMGQIGYEAYRAHTGGISLASGQPIPDWSALKPEIQAAWDAAGEEIRKHVVGAMASIEAGLGMISDGPLRAILLEIVATDKTSYDAGDPRRLDGREPNPGIRWDTPKELALEALGISEDEARAEIAAPSKQLLRYLG